ncbi:hypothetical protein [Microbacterium gilvum]|uniref:Uncharacterized protein n=1 Tax=Microbacterium gilvum TaxID=1336204 RepID=A0ABP9A5T6_9MICO
MSIPQPPYHVMLMTQEINPGHWLFGDANSGTIADIELRRTNVGPRYRITMAGEVMGWTTTLKSACEGAWARHERMRATVYEGAPNRPLPRPSVTL